jgi:hypothetical protein
VRSALAIMPSVTMMEIDNKRRRILPNRMLAPPLPHVNLNDSPLIRYANRAVKPLSLRELALAPAQF